MSDLLNKLNNGYYKNYKKNGDDITLSTKLLLWYYDINKSQQSKCLTDISFNDVLNGLNISEIQYHLTMDYLENIDYINKDGITKLGIKYLEECVLKDKSEPINKVKFIDKTNDYNKDYNSFLLWIAEVEFCSLMGKHCCVPFNIVLNNLNITESIAATIHKTLINNGIIIKTNDKLGYRASPLQLSFILNNYLKVENLDCVYKDFLSYHYSNYKTLKNFLIHNEYENKSDDENIRYLIDNGYLFCDYTVPSINNSWFRLTHKGYVYCIINFETDKTIFEKTGYVIPKTQNIH